MRLAAGEREVITESRVVRWLAVSSIDWLGPINLRADTLKDALGERTAYRTQD